MSWIVQSWVEPVSFQFQLGGNGQKGNRGVSHTCNELHVRQMHFSKRISSPNDLFFFFFLREAVK